MGIIAFIISILILILQVYKNRERVINPITFFFALWSFILLLSNMNLYGMHKPSWEAYFLIGIMEVFFYLGSLLNTKKILLPKKLKNLYIKHLKCRKTNYNIVYLLCFLIIMFNIIDLVIVFKLYFNNVPMWQIRNWILSPFGTSNPILDRRSFIEEIIRTIILTPSIIVIYPIAAYSLFNEKNRKRKVSLMILSVFVLASGSLANAGGRLGFLYYFLCICMSFFVKYDKMNKNKSIELKELFLKYKNIIIFIASFAFLIVVGFTIIRTDVTRIFKQFYTYFAMPPTLLGEWLPQIKTMQHTYGFLTFFGFHSYFFRFFKMAGLDFLVPEVFNNAFLYMLNAEKFIQIGSGNSNAFVTPIYYFYLDGGYPFTMIASLFFGYIVSCFYNIFKNNINIKSFTIYSLVMYAVFLSFMRIQLVIPTYILSFLIIYVIFSKKIYDIFKHIIIFINNKAKKELKDEK